MAKHIIDNKGHASKGLRISSKSTGKLCSLVDLKQLKLIKPNTAFVNDYVKAEHQRQHLLDKHGATMYQVAYSKGKKIKVVKATPTANTIIFG